MAIALDCRTPEYRTTALVAIQHSGKIWKGEYYKWTEGVKVPEVVLVNLVFQSRQKGREDGSTFPRALKFSF